MCLKSSSFKETLWTKNKNFFLSNFHVWIGEPISILVDHLHGHINIQGTDHAKAKAPLLSPQNLLGFANCATNRSLASLNCYFNGLTEKLDRVIFRASISPYYPCPQILRDRHYRHCPSPGGFIFIIYLSSALKHILRAVSMSSRSL
jgi:hypothetical protein